MTARVARGASAVRLLVNVLTSVVAVGVVLFFAVTALLAVALAGGHAFVVTLLALAASAVALAATRAKRADALDLLARAENVLAPSARRTEETAVSARVMARALLERAEDAALGPLLAGLLAALGVLSIVFVLGEEFGHVYFARLAAFAWCVVVVVGLLPYFVLRSCLSSQFDRILGLPPAGRSSSGNDSETTSLL
jgi:hypothetical protein